MLENLQNYRIILASNSPRRKALLEGIGLPFIVKKLSDVDESYPAGLQGGDIPMYLSQVKANAYRPMMQPDDLVITADTIVYMDGKVYGKPADEKEAISMLKALSGRTHHVYTGVSLTSRLGQSSFYADSEVRFASLSEEEISWYVTHCHPMDKAGAYGVQEWIGYIGVEYISGSYFNVMGLPIQRLYAELKEFI